MKLSELWLREWVNPPINTTALCDRLTMAGLEIDDVQSVENNLNEMIIDVAITPNRGDCLSVQGLAREVSALTETEMTPLVIQNVKAVVDVTLPVELAAPMSCPRYLGRVIQNVNAKTPTPQWMKDRLDQAGMKSISAIVDVTNYVMLELGQPMHAFDLGKIQSGIHIRMAKSGEKIKLLDNSEKTLDADTLVIADHKQPLAIAGVMGGLDSGVMLETQAIFLESAFFTPETVARQRQHYQLASDSAYRFERGVDNHLQSVAIERATALICEIAGGKPGPVIVCQSEKYLPAPQTVILPTDKIKAVLGFVIADEKIASIFRALQFNPKKVNDHWQVSVPSYRFDIRLPEDLIEELARVYGYNHIPTRALRAELQTQAALAQDNEYLLRQAFEDHAYHEIISYAFVAENSQQLLDPDSSPHALINPITSDMKVMRTNLWPGLVNTLLYNSSRQQERVRLFEIGVCFGKNEAGKVIETPRLGGIIAGPVAPLQWGEKERRADFFDLKGDLENVLRVFKIDYDFRTTTHPALHPGQTAAIFVGDKQIGIMGALHPKVCESLNLHKYPFVFELELNSLRKNDEIQSLEASKYPEIRRDLAILVDQNIQAKVISDTIKSIAGHWLQGVFIFDVYQGKGIAANQKSIALALILQHPTRTLIDNEVATLMEQVVAALKGNLGAELRS